MLLRNFGTCLFRHPISLSCCIAHPYSWCVPRRNILCYKSADPSHGTSSVPISLRDATRNQRRFFADQPPGKASKDDFPFPLKYIQVRALKGLFLEQYAEDEVTYTPPHGLLFNVAYVDTGFPADRDEFDPYVDVDGKRMINPTVLCVHGAGGNHKDHAAVIRALAARGARVIAPVFPGFSGPTYMDTKEVYSHSMEENTYFLADFLDALAVTKLDVVIAFSAGCHAAVPLSSRAVVDARGLALLQVPGHRIYKGLQPYRLKKFFMNLMQWKFLRRLVTPLAYIGQNIFGKLPKKLPVDQLFVMGQTGYGVDFHKYQAFASEIAFSKIPLLMTFSENDEFVDTEISYEFAKFLGIRLDEMTVYDKEGNIIKDRVDYEDRDHYIRCLVFQKGGHFAHRKEPTATIIVRAVEELFDHVMGENRRRHQEMLTFYEDRPFGYLPARPNANLLLK